MVAGMIRRSRWMRWGAVGAAAAVALTGCVGEEESVPTATPGPSSAPSSPESLLDEARATYEGFLTTSAAMWAEEQVDYTLFLDWSSDEIATDEAAAHEALRAQGVAEIGPVTLQAIELADTPTADEVDVRLCLNFEDARRLNETGQDVTPPDAQALVALQVRFEPGSERLIITEQEPLPEGVDSPCDS